MGYALVHSACCGCGRVIGYNPHRVPSVTINGSREPVCSECIRLANGLRADRGLPPIVPHPDAYEPIHESEL